MPQLALDPDVGEVRERPLDPAGRQHPAIAHEHRPHTVYAADGVANLGERADSENELRNNELADSPTQPHRRAGRGLGVHRRGRAGCHRAILSLGPCANAESDLIYPAKDEATPTGGQFR